MGSLGVALASSSSGFIHATCLCVYLCSCLYRRRRSNCGRAGASQFARLLLEVAPRGRGAPAVPIARYRTCWCHTGWRPEIPNLYHTNTHLSIHRHFTSVHSRKIYEWAIRSFVRSLGIHNRSSASNFFSLPPIQIYDIFSIQISVRINNQVYK